MVATSHERTRALAGEATTAKDAPTEFYSPLAAGIMETGFQQIRAVQIAPRSYSWDGIVRRGSKSA